jgi:hypothetical protein
MGVAVFVVVSDVTKNFSSVIVNGGKDNSGHKLSLDFGEPGFGLVKPRGSEGVKFPFCQVWRMNAC